MTSLYLWRRHDGYLDVYRSTDGRPRFVGVVTGLQHLLMLASAGALDLNQFNVKVVR